MVCHKELSQNGEKKYMSSNELPGVELFVGTAESDMIKVSVKSKSVETIAYYIDTEFKYNGKSFTSGWVIKLTSKTAVFISEDDFAKFFSIIEEA